MKRQVALVLALLGISGLTNGVSLQRSAKGPDHAAAESRSMDWLSDMAEWIEGTDDEIADIVEDVEEIDGDVMDLVDQVDTIYDMGGEMNEMIEDNADDINDHKENIGDLIQDVIEAFDQMGSFESGSGSNESDESDSSSSESESNETTEVPTVWPTTEGLDCPSKHNDDNHCDDGCNTAEYNYDGGDCCPTSPEDGWDDYCDDCECKNPVEPTTNWSYCPDNYIGDGWYCDEACNTAQFDYDGGDCCLGNFSTHYCDVCECIGFE